MFSAPIPGQSLTAEPKNTPFERPPQIVDPIEALDLHIDNVTRMEAMEDMFFFLESGLPMTDLVQGILRSAVMSGVHSVDTSLIIAPVLHEEIKALAMEAGVEFDEGFEDDETKNAMDYERDVSRAKKMLDELKQTQEDSVEVEVSIMPMEMEVAEEPEMEQEEEAPEEKPKGLMARG